jgi:hypothetical protein
LDDIDIRQASPIPLEFSDVIASTAWDLVWHDELRLDQRDAWLALSLRLIICCVLAVHFLQNGFGL